jgi:hypothetical protein
MRIVKGLVLLLASIIIVHAAAAATWPEKPVP